MPSTPSGEGLKKTAVPSMVDLVRLARHPAFPPGGPELYRQIARLTDLSETSEVLVVACGLAVTVEYFVREFGVEASGVDEDARAIESAEGRLRDAGLLDRAHLQHAPVDKIPFKDGIFDVTVAELALTARADPADAIAEVVRVTKPGGHVVLVQPMWKAPVDEARRGILSEHLGTRPLMLVEWKKLLKEAGLENLHIEDWSDEETAFRPKVSKPFPDFAELFSVREKLGILRRAWGIWGWRGAWTALAREREVHNLLTRERILGLDLVKGTRPFDGGPQLGGSLHDDGDAEPITGDAARQEAELSGAEVTDLPLFGAEADGT